MASSDFEALLTRRGPGMSGPHMWPFDLLRLDGADIRLNPIEDRRAELERVVAGVDAILFSDAIAAEGELVFAKACEMGLEGIVSKRADSRYASGSSRAWLKCKNRAFVRGSAR